MKRIPFFEPGRRTIGVLAAAALVLIASASLAGAAGGAPQPRLATKAGPAVAGQSSGGACRLGYDTETGTFTPPNSITSTTPAAATVTLTKQCQGAVIGRFTSEVATTVSTGFMGVEMRATCTGTGGFTSPCTVGQQVVAQPGLTDFQTNAGQFGAAHAMDMVWPGLKRGVWRFDVLGLGDGTSILAARTFTVTAVTGG